ncbi:MAG: PAS domain S-box protein [Spirochaetota bacterium]|nr:PAS domain S-box protein [Spirochaetota bacterium]
MKITYKLLISHILIPLLLIITFVFLNYKMNNQIQKYILIIIPSSLIFSIILGYFVAKSIVKPITKIKTAVIELGKGKQETKIKVSSKDEIGELANALSQTKIKLNIMQNDLLEQSKIKQKQIEDELNEYREELEALVESRTEELKETVNKLNLEIAERKQAELRLLETETFKENLINSSLDMIIAVDRDRNIIIFNKAAEKNFGYSVQEIIGKNIEILYDNFNDKSIVNKAVRDTGQFSGEIINKRKDGTTFPAFISASSLYNSEGMLIGYMGISHDISLRKTFEDKWKKYEFIANASKEHMSLINKDYIYEAVNDSYCLASNRSREDIIGTRVIDVWGKERFDKFIKPLLETCFTGNEAYDSNWLEFRRGEKSYFDIIYYPYFNEKNIVTHAVVISRDITAYKLVEMSLLESQKFTKNLIDSSLDMIIAVNNDRNIIMFNKAAEKTFGYSSAEIIGKNIEILYDKDEDRNNISKAFNELGQFSGEVINKRKDGTTFPAFISASVLRNPEGKSIGFMGISRDITENKKVEKMRENVESIMRHDLKSPIAAIIGFTDILCDKASPEQSQILSFIHNSAYKIIRMVDHSLDLFKMEKGNFTLQAKDFDLIKCFKSLDKELEAKKNGNIKLVFMLNDNLISFENSSYIVYGDSIHLERLFANLINNAVEASPEHSNVTVSITGGKDNHVIDVHNFGIIPLHIRDKFFDPYVTAKRWGTGLGTYSAQLIAKAHGGKITFTTSEQDGTHLIVTLPKR